MKLKIRTPSLKKSLKARPKVVTMLEKGGGIYNSTLKRNTNYLIVGDEGSEKWSHNVYGDKVAKALELNKKGYDIKICGESAITALMEGLYV